MFSISPLTLSANFQFSDSGRERALCHDVAVQDHQGWAVLALFYLDNLDILSCSLIGPDSQSPHNAFLSFIALLSVVLKVTVKQRLLLLLLLLSRAFRNITTKGCPTDEADVVKWTLDGSCDCRTYIMVEVQSNKMSPLPILQREKCSSGGGSGVEKFTVFSPTS